MDSGAHYFKTDLQVHTPRDPNWKGARPKSDEDRREYADQLVAACRSTDLGAVAITDHHDLALVDFVRAAAAHELDDDGEPLAEDARLIVFPGVELTLAVPCQALLILDADFPSDKLQTVLDVLAITPSDPTAPVSAPVEQLEIRDFNELYARLDAHAWLRSHYVVFPNVTDGGHRTLMRQGMQKVYKDMPCVGGYIDGDATATGTGNLLKFAGKDRAWGYKRIAVMQTSDARDGSFQDLGTYPTWIKWAQPTAEALRQACLAEESRITLTEPALPGVVVERLHISNSKFMGPVDVELNPQYNALIGGRGTGKSTCLEYLRWALCDQPPHLEEPSEIPDLAARRERLVAQTLVPVDGQVEVHFRLSGTAHMVRRYGRSGEVMLKVGSNELTPASPGDIRSLLPIEAYSQRQLSSVGVRLQELTRFVTTPIRERLDDIDSRATKIAGSVRENHAQLERYRILQSAINKDAFSLESLRLQAESVRAKLAGLSASDREALAAKPRYDQAAEIVERLVRRLGRAKDEAQSFASAVGGLQSDVAASLAPDLPEGEILNDLQTEMKDVLARLAEFARAADELLAAAARPGSRFADLHEQWEARLKKFQSTYAAATERSTAHKSKLQQLEEIEARELELRRTVDGNRDELTSLGDPVARHAALRAEWRKTQEERSGVLIDQCVALTELSDGLIRASVRRGAGTARLHERFKSAVAGSGLRGSKMDAFLSAVSSADDPLATWHAALDELEQRILAGPDALSGLEPPTTALKAFSDTDLAKITQRVTSEQVLDLCLLPLEDHPVFEYRAKEGEYIAFEDASAGQQATALLRVLLRHGGPPLVIDQPEDDLDSQVILEIVEEIWTAKKQRQVIFSSHNANLVVNGDAELVACCDYRTAGDQSGGRIKLQGAIDVPDVRREITTVMEGGERAFRLRKEKYGF